MTKNTIIIIYKITSELSVYKFPFGYSLNWKNHEYPREDGFHFSWPPFRLNFRSMDARNSSRIQVHPRS